MTVPGVMTRMISRLTRPLASARVLGLLADGDLVALGDQARDVGVARMIGNAAHRRLILRRLAAVAGRQRQIELARGELSILVEHLVEVAQAEKRGSNPYSVP